MSRHSSYGNNSKNYRATESTRGRNTETLALRAVQKFLHKHREAIFNACDYLGEPSARNRAHDLISSVRGATHLTGSARRNLVEIHRLLCGKSPDWRPPQLFDMFHPEEPAHEEIAQLADALLDVLEYLDELGERLWSALRPRGPKSSTPSTDRVVRDGCGPIRAGTICPMSHKPVSAESSIPGAAITALSAHQRLETQAALAQVRAIIASAPTAAAP